MAGDDQSDDKTETATTRHMDQARDGGQVAVSRELVTFASLGAVVLTLGYQSQSIMLHLLPNMVMFLARTGELSALGPAQIRSMLVAVLGAIAPALAAATLSGAGVVLLQTRFLLHLGGLQPKVSRVSPTAGLKRVFGVKGAVEMVKALVKLGMLGLAIWMATRGDWIGLVRLPWQDPKALLSAIAQPAFHLFIAAVAVQSVVAAADLFWVRFSHARDLRMSKQDVRDEMKDTEGNPHVKARIHRIRVLRARKRMMANVPTATVVVTNPTHFAVALAYDRGANPAPRIVAKGADTVAARIREIAANNGVPVVSNPPLARALYRLELDTEIPADQYKAVAEIIAYVWRLRNTGQAIS